MTAEMYKVLPIEGKGLGAVASKFIKKGTLILNEKPQISLENDPEIPLEIHIRQVISCFYEMSESDQDEFMRLYNKFDGDHVKSESNLGLALREGLLEIKKVVNIPKLQKIFCIYTTNTFHDGLRQG